MRVRHLCVAQLPDAPHIRYAPRLITNRAKNQSLTAADKCQTQLLYPLDTAPTGILFCDVLGTYHNMSKKYLPLYLAELQYRFNNRQNPNIFFDVIAGC